MAAAAVTAAAAMLAAAWITPFDAFSSKDWSCFQEIHPFALAFDARERPFSPYPELLARSSEARPAGVKLIPVLVNDVFAADGKPESASLKSRAPLRRWLADGKSRDRHVEDLAALAAPYEGLELDYERVPAGLWDAYAELVEKLADKLHAQGKVVHVDLEHEPVVAGGASTRRALRRLGEAADRVNVMTYYERGALAVSPGPGSTPEFVTRVGQSALDLFPASKLTLVLTLAAQDYRVPLPVLNLSSRFKRLHYRAARELMSSASAPPAWDDGRKAPYFEYAAAGARHQVWFEDERTLGAKVAAVRSLGAGVGLWYLGEVRPDLRAIGLCR